MFANSAIVVFGPLWDDNIRSFGGFSLKNEYHKSFSCLLAKAILM